MEVSTSMKKSTMLISEATFKKHDYVKPKKKIKRLDNFDSIPPHFRGLPASRLPALLDKVRGEQLGISFLLDSSFREGSPKMPASYHMPDSSKLCETISAFKKTLEMSDDKAHKIKRNMR